MSTSMPTLLSSKPHFTFSTTPSSSHRFQPFPSLSLPKVQAFKPQLTPNNVSGVFPKAPRFYLWKRCAINDDDAVVGLDEAEKEGRGRSSMPERFRHLAKEAPNTSIRWPWLVVLAVIIYAWRAVLFELSNWRNAVFGIIRFIGYVFKYAFAVFYRFIRNPITFSVRCVEDLLHTIQVLYSSIINYTPISDLTITIVLASVVLATAEATVPNCVNDQPYVLTISGLLGYAAVRGYISEPLFWTLLLGVYGLSKVLKKRDNVSSAMSVAAVLAAVGEPWVRVLVIISFTALAIFQHSKMLQEGKEVETVERRLPIPLLLAAVAIGLRVAAKWAGYQHLTWMIV